MRRTTIPVLAGTVVLAYMAFASNSLAQSKTKAKGTGKSSAASSTKARRNATGHATATSTRLVRNRKGKLVRVAAVHTPPPPSYQLHPDSDRYVEIQKALTDRGYFKGEANGQWGDDSVAALRRFQADAKLPDDGKINALSLSGLGLGPNHDGSSASTVPMPPTAPTPSVTSTTAGPAVSSPAPPPLPPY